MKKHMHQHKMRLLYSDTKLKVVNQYVEQMLVNVQPDTKFAKKTEHGEHVKELFYHKMKYVITKIITAMNLLTKILKTVKLAGQMAEVSGIRFVR